ncbi:MAG: hypothetical protein KF680_07200 [Cryobacterium sp.]|nr:hypothetical protein [Cryobacterium sp.]
MTSDLNRVEYATAGPDTALNVRHVRHDTAYPGAGAAAGILSRAQGRGRRLDITGVASYSVLPGQAARITPPDTELQTGYVASVVYDLAAATMRVRSRGLVDTPPYSYLAAPDGLSYLDVPIGMSYLDYDPDLIGA